jgi:hypothetical protein
VKASSLYKLAALESLLWDGILPLHSHEGQAGVQVDPDPAGKLGPVCGKYDTVDTLYINLTILLPLLVLWDLEGHVIIRPP